MKDERNDSTGRVLNCWKNSLLTFQNPGALGEVRIVVWIVWTIKFLLSLVTDGELLAGVLDVSHLTSHNLLPDERGRSCLNDLPTSAGGQ